LDGTGRIPVQMFFYGTLKRGGSNHAYCRGGRMTAVAMVEGLLYDLPQGYPALVVPEASVVSVGTDDPLNDAHAGNALDQAGLPEPEKPAVHGELYTFDDPEDRLPSLDELEDFSPGDPSSPYRRVLVPVRLDGGGVTAAWTYAVRGLQGTHLPGGRWPA
jgi:gamma-glutamylcyclotransferase (GGCT)/AIG2-like uncharacterized protein YtfP